MNKKLCKNCKFWDLAEFEVSSKHRRCLSSKCDEHNQPEDSFGILGLEVDGAFCTGAEFGCIHFTDK